MKRLHRLGIVFIVLVMFLVTACGSSSQPTNTGSSGTSGEQQGSSDAGAESDTDSSALERTKLVAGSSVRNIGFLSMYVADQKGFFKEEGLDVEIQYFNSGREAFQAQLAGAIDIDAQGLTEAIDAYIAGQPAKAFWGVSNYPVYEWWASPHIQSIEQAKEMDLKVAISSVGSLSHLISVFALEQAGFDVENKVNFVGLGSSSTRLAALQAGQVDMIPATPPDNFILEEEGYNQLVLLRDYMHEFQYEILMANTDFLANNPNTVRAFLRAMSKGAQFIIDDPKESAQILANVVGYKPEQMHHVERAVELMAGSWPVDGHFAEEGVALMLDFYESTGDLQQRPTHEELLEYKFVKEFQQ